MCQKCISRCALPYQLLQVSPVSAGGIRPALFTASKRYLGECGFEIAYLTDDLHASGFAPNYISEHEALYAGQGLPIHFMIARMLPGEYPPIHESTAEEPSCTDARDSY